jgi:hypothetical protein
MHHRLLPLALALAGTAALAAAPVPVLKFEGAIGVDPLTAAPDTSTPDPTDLIDVRNVVRGINPGGRAWVIRKLDATVYSDGSIVARGKGLLFSSGEAIATRGTVGQVVATLACGPADTTATKYTSEPGALNLAGNFNIRSLLRGSDGNIAPLETVPCANPQLLIRAFSATGPGGWFAAGILERDDD